MVFSASGPTLEFLSLYTMTTPPMEIKNWLKAILNRAQHCHWLPEEKLQMELHLDAWDPGALRTVQAYHEHAADAERFLLRYYFKFFDTQHQWWHCINASACAVWLCRQCDSDH
jgi:hypothetical protein